MKINKKLRVILLAAVIASCSSDDNSNSTPETPGTPGTPEEQETTFAADVTNISVLNSAGTAPTKGDELSMSITLVNSGNSNGTVEVSPKLSSKRFEDFTKVSIAPIEVALDAGETAVVNVAIGPFIQDDTNDKRYALNSGDYEVEAISIDDTEDTEFEGGTFSVESSNRILVPVLYDPAYLETIMYTEGIETYLTSAFTRTVEVFDNGNYTTFNGGVDEMMDIEHVFYPISTTNISEYPLEGDLCVKSAALAAEELGLAQSWAGPSVGTQVGNHGFDYLISLAPDSIGGTFCETRDGQISGTNDTDLSVNRSQFTIAHQTGHILGAQHCDANQEFVMCAGERNPKYIDEGIFVFDKASRDMMANKFE